MAVLPLPPLPEPPLEQWLSEELSPMPTPLIELPQTLTGMLIGISIRLPEPTPGEWVAEPFAVLPAEPAFVQVLPVALSRMPTTEMLLPQTLTGMLTGIWIRLPDSSPGESAAVPVAESACAMPMPRPPTSRPPVVIPRTTRRFVE